MQSVLLTGFLAALLLRSGHHLTFQLVLAFIIAWQWRAENDWLEPWVRRVPLGTPVRYRPHASIPPTSTREQPIELRFAQFNLIELRI